MSHGTLLRKNISNGCLSLFLLPSFVIIFLTVAYPLFYGFYLSTTNLSLGNFSNPSFVGLANYIAIFDDGEIWSVFNRTVIWTFVNIFFHVFFGLSLALILNSKILGTGYFRLLLIIPWALPQYIAVLTFKGMFNSQFGSINLILDSMGIGAIAWLSDDTLAFVASIITNIWLGFPFMMMICLGALQSIPVSIYEAADIDGASEWDKFWNITLPLIKPVLLPSIVLGTVWTFNMVNVIVILTGGYSKEGTQILVTQVYRLAFSFYKYSYAAAYSVIIFILLLVFVFVFSKKMNLFGEERQKNATKEVKFEKY